MSIVDPKYAEALRNTTDFIGEFIADNCTVETSPEVKEKDPETKKMVVKRVAKTAVDFDSLIELGRVNFLPEDKLKAYAKSKKDAGATGRVRMSIGNMLRARALRRHGLYNLKGKWVNAPADFLDGAEQTEDRKGEKLAKKAA